MDNVWQEEFEDMRALKHAADAVVAARDARIRSLEVELADWQRMRNEAMAVATSNRARINELEAQLRIEESNHEVCAKMNSGLRTALRKWETSCTGMHGSQMQCVNVTLQKLGLEAETTDQQCPHAKGTMTVNECVSLFRCDCSLGTDGTWPPANAGSLHAWIREGAFRLHSE